jgi:hypothetical protein
MLRSILTLSLTISGAYLLFCAFTLGYFVEPEEWFNGAYKNPPGHICLRSPDTCRQYARRSSYDGR